MLFFRSKGRNLKSGGVHFNVIRKENITKCMLDHTERLTSHFLMNELCPCNLELLLCEQKTTIYSCSSFSWLHLPGSIVSGSYFHTFVVPTTKIVKGKQSHQKQYLNGVHITHFLYFLSFNVWFWFLQPINSCILVT